jgi:hypothetical protein
MVSQISTRIYICNSKTWDILPDMVSTVHVHILLMSRFSCHICGICIIFWKNVNKQKFMLSCIWITSREGLQWMHFKGKLLLELYFSLLFSYTFHSNKVLPYYMFLVFHMRYRYFGQLLWFSIITLNYRGVFLATHYGFFSVSIMPALTQFLTYHLAN